MDFADPVLQQLPPTMSPEALVIANDVREALWAFDAGGRSAQVEIGASELGHPCDRRLAYKSAGAPVYNRKRAAVGWAAMVGTGAHILLAEAFQKRNGNSGRYLIEHKILKPVRGTLDCFDRATGTVYDWKVPGDWSMKKVLRDGVSHEYRIQRHLYGMGLQLQGETVKRVANVWLPRNSPDLLDMFVDVEDYMPQVARAAVGA